MEVFNNLTWNLKKKVLKFHSPYIFEELKIFFINRRLNQRLERNTFEFDRKEHIIIVRDIITMYIIFDMFKDELVKYTIDTTQMDLYFSEFMIKVVPIPFECILLEFTNLGIQFTGFTYPSTTMSYCLDEDENIHVRIFSSVRVREILGRIGKYISNQEVFAWNRTGEHYEFTINGENKKKLYIWIEVRQYYSNM